MKIDNYATEYINKEVYIKIDRPLGSVHPEWKDHIYPINYGFIPDTNAPDGKEIDAFILGVKNPIKEFTGICIAVIHRINDNDDKLIVVPKGKQFTDEEIKELTYFQEKYFKSEIIRKMQIKKGKYKHFKGSIVEVIGTALHSETQEEMVIYIHPDAVKGEAAHTTFVSPKKMFLEKVVKDGKEIPRFEFLE